MRHLLLQSGKCLTRARFTALLSGRDPITTIVGILNFLSNVLGLIILNPPNVAPASRIGDSRARSELSILDATPVASNPSTPIHAVLAFTRCGPFSCTATSGALEPPSLLDRNGPSSIPTQLVIVLFREALRCIIQEPSNEPIAAKRRCDGARLDSQPDLLRPPVPAKAHNTGINNSHEVKLVQQSAHPPLSQRFHGRSSA